ncbi:MAG: LON peptidase substrate-binding domain-containing protein, partial [Pseudomonadota bacterium]
MSAHYKSLARRTTPSRIPIFPLSGAVLLPVCDLPLNIFEPRYLNMIDDALKGDRL